MNTEKDENLDKLFKKGLEDPVSEPAFREADWDAMEQMLDKGKKRSGIIYLLPIISGIAAILLIFLGYFFFKGNETKPEKKNQVAATHSNKSEAIDKAKNNTGTNGGPARQVADSGKQQKTSAQDAATGLAQVSRPESGKTFFPLSSGKVRRSTGNKGLTLDANNIPKVLPGNDANNDKIDLATPDSKANQKNDVLANNKTVTGDKTTPTTADNKTSLGTADGKANQQGDVLANNGNNAPKSIDKTSPGTADGKTSLGTADSKGGQKVIASNTTKTSVSRNLGNRPIFALGVIASSDLNGVNSAFQQTKIGGNFGAMFSVTFKKLTISTGAQYDIKPYLTNFDNYHTSYQFPTNPSTVQADCRMLDIPLNVNYQVYRQRANSITIGTGLSSYFMLREDYQFNYNNGNNGYGGSTPTGPLHYTVVNRNHNILSVLNLDATYTHQINSKFGVTVQPYTKVPLSDVGASQVRLQSTGVAFGINWNINASSKPK
ncbi:MAG: hypothetical protein JST50_04445 [Bacteroidetes bacterium]|jgi:hypothetical protein|nr:hypothetical protein [Bacteroidota bacterium]